LRYGGGAWGVSSRTPRHGGALDTLRYGGRRGEFRQIGGNTARLPDDGSRRGVGVHREAARALALEGHRPTGKRGRLGYDPGAEERRWRTRSDVCWVYDNTKQCTHAYGHIWPVCRRKKYGGGSRKSRNGLTHLETLQGLPPSTCGCARRGLRRIRTRNQASAESSVKFRSCVRKQAAGFPASPCPGRPDFQ